MDGKSSFKNLIPILRNKEILPLLYKLNDQFSLEVFLKNQKINLSIEEIEKLWDIIEVCKSSYNIEEDSDSVSNNKDLEYKDEDSNHTISESELNVSGGKGKFYSNISKIAGILE